MGKKMILKKRNIPPDLLKYFRLKKQNRWILRNKIIWNKSNSMPSSVKDRLTNVYEPMFFFVKSKKYHFDLDAIRVPLKDVSLQRQKYPLTSFGSGKGGACWGKNTKEYPSKQGKNPNDWEFSSLGKNPGDVWEIPTQGIPDLHYAVFPEKLVETPILAGCPCDGVVLDCFGGSGTVGLVAERLSRNWILIELNESYCSIAKQRISQEAAQIKMKL